VNATIFHDPQSASYGNMSTFQIAIRNLSDKPVTLTTNSFTLIDADGRQYPAMDVKEVAETSTRMYCSPSYWGGYSGWGWPDHRVGIGYEHQLYCDPFTSQMLSESLLPAGPLKPDGKARGLLFFRGTVEDYAQVTVELDLPGQAPLRFPFRGVRD
jgi:hypothetical protein